MLMRKATSKTCIDTHPYTRSTLDIQNLHAGSRKLSQSSVTIINKSPETSVSFPVKTPCVGTQCCEPTDCVCMGDCVEYPFGYGDITTSAAVAATAATTAATTAETATVSSSSNASAQVRGVCYGTCQSCCPTYQITVSV